MEMQTLYYITFLFLHLSIVLSVSSPPCNSDNQYGWPYENPTHCCKKCKPGEHMVKRCITTNFKDTQCKPCDRGRYTETLNIDSSCEFCYDCNISNMEYKRPCKINRNSQCQCKTGYRCTQEPCLRCETMPATPRPTNTTTASVSHPVTKSKPTHREADTPGFTTLGKVTKPDQVIKPTDITWIVVVSGGVFLTIVLIVITKRKSFLRWIKSKGLCSPQKTYVISVTDDSEDVPMPVQEMCGKCDQPIAIDVDDDTY